MTPPKLIAFYLPQFHRIPENDAWWGDGFTEWSNVRKATPLYPGHAQPRVPAHGNYYDLSDPTVQAWQADLARRHGIHGFCYYHYWFAGRRLLERPAEQMLERALPDFPFCLAWANEPWTRAWDGDDREVLMPQAYGGAEDWDEHFDVLLRFFRDARYIRVEGCPVFLIYRSHNIERCDEMLERWRELASQAGLPGLHIVTMATIYGADDRTALFDACCEFEPMYTIANRRSYLARRLNHLVNQWTRLQWKLRGTAPRAPNSEDYGTLWRDIANRPLQTGHYPGAFVDWDNSPRRGLWRSLVMRGFHRDVFEECFGRQYRKASEAQAGLLFINAWNEWAEGTYLEPDEARGTFFLEAISRVVKRQTSGSERSR